MPSAKRKLRKRDNSKYKKTNINGEFVEILFYSWHNTLTLVVFFIECNFAIDGNLRLSFPLAAVFWLEDAQVVCACYSRFCRERLFNAGVECINLSIGGGGNYF